MIVVSDSSPLITFARTSLFYLLGQLFNEIAIPEEVYMEVAVRGAGLPGATQTRAGELGSDHADSEHDSISPVARRLPPRRG